jgi:hypothetical protein
MIYRCVSLAQHGFDIILLCASHIDGTPAGRDACGYSRSGRGCAKIADGSVFQTAGWTSM